MAKLLLIDDDKPFSEWLGKELCAYHSLSWAGDGNRGIELLNAIRPDILLLDLHMPGLTGFSVLKHRLHQTKTCVLTGSLELDDKLRSFALGADDVLLKPFPVEELVCRINALLRRKDPSSHDSWEIDDSCRTVRIGCKSIVLPNKEYAVLRYFLHRPDSLITRSELIDQVWQRTDCFPNTVDTTVERLRRRLQATFGRRLVKTVYGRGYYLDTSSDLPGDGTHLPNKPGGGEAG